MKETSLQKCISVCVVACQLNVRTTEIHVSEFLAEQTQVLAVTQFRSPFACQLLKLDVHEMKIPVLATAASLYLKQQKEHLE